MHVCIQMARTLLIFSFVVVWTTSCRTESKQEGNPALQEIPIEGAFSNAELIRNPVSADGKTTGEVAELAFKEVVYSFGTASEGTLVEYTFHFENTGDAPLLISRAYSTCGCTVPVWPQEPIKPGESGEINVRFDTQGKIGAQRKPIYVVANTLPATSTVYLEGEVVKAN